jgi:hypothetical protein
MRRLLLITLIAALPVRQAAADPRAPEPGQPPEQTPAQQAAQEMMQVYEEFCLARFPDPKAFAEGAAAHHMAPENADQAAKILLGRPGDAWRLTTPKATYDVAIQAGGRQGCVVSGQVADDAGIRAAFDLLVGIYASSHELGTLSKPPLRTGLVKQVPAALQIIGATPDGRPRQAFVNMSTGQGPVMQVRMTREFAPRP